ARDKVRFELWMELEIRAPQAIHPEHPSEVVAVERREPGDRENAHQQNDREHEDGDGDERWPEMIGLHDEGERDHRTRQDRQEHVDSPERLGVRQRTRRKQAPVLGGEDLELGSDPWLSDWRNLSRHVVLLNPRQVHETTAGRRAIFYPPVFA